MSPAAEQQLRLQADWQGRPTPEQIAKALKLHLCLTGLRPGELVPATKDYAVANRLRNNLLVKAYAVLKQEGLIQLNPQRRHELKTDQICI